MTKIPKSIRDNLSFLTVEVDSQLENLQLFLRQPTAALARRILDRAGYAYNLKTRIHAAAVSGLSKGRVTSQKQLTLRGAEFIATDLERLSEICRNCVNLCEQISDPDGLFPKHYHDLLKQVRSALNLIEPAMLEQDSQKAIAIGQTLQDQENRQQKLFKRYVSVLKKRRDVENVTQALFIAYEIQQMGKVLLHISEALISASLGQPVSFERYFSIQSLTQGMESEEELVLEPIAQTRSGSAISGITSPGRSTESAGDKREYLAIYKDGERQKLKEEKQGVNSWHEIYPGLAPRILSYKKRGESASLLIEHLPGYTFEHLVLNESPELVNSAVQRLGKTLLSIWKHTRSDSAEPAEYMKQLRKRLPEVYRIHPEFERSSVDVCGVVIPAYETLIAQAEKIESHFPAAFSVYIHGDFNIDNIIFDPIEKRINFIDLHRSRYMDYVQDISVFMVSNYRLQILDGPRRQRLMAVAQALFQTAKRYAAKQKDTSFELRLALGLARSFATSTRFILDKSLARSMFLRSRYLLEKILTIKPGEEARFRLPVKELFVE